MTFGAGQGNFLIDSPATVAQLVKTRLALFLAEWFVDLTQGTPWFQQVFGRRTEATRDLAIRARILQTQGVKAIVSYSSSVIGRAFRFETTIDTIYGGVSISETIALPSPSRFGQLDFSNPDNSAFINA